MTETRDGLNLALAAVAECHVGGFTTWCDFDAKTGYAIAMSVSQPGDQIITNISHAFSEDGKGVKSVWFQLYGKESVVFLRDALDALIAAGVLR